MRKMILAVLVSSLFGFGCGKNSCDKLKSELCGGDAECEKGFDKEGKADKELSSSDKEAICKAMLDSKDELESMKKMMKKDKKGGGDDKKEEKKDEKKDDAK